jgi:hypothetical protein
MELLIGKSNLIIALFTGIIVPIFLLLNKNIGAKVNMSWKLPD